MDRYVEGWSLDGGGGLAKINCFPSCKITDGLRRRTTASVGGTRGRQRSRAVLWTTPRLGSEANLSNFAWRAAVKLDNEQGTYRGATVSPPTVDVLAFLIVKTSFVAHWRLPPSDRY